MTPSARPAGPTEHMPSDEDTGGSETDQGCKFFFFAHSPRRTSGWKKLLALMTSSLALVWVKHLPLY